MANQKQSSLNTRVLFKRRIIFCLESFYEIYHLKTTVFNTCHTGFFVCFFFSPLSEMSEFVVWFCFFYCQGVSRLLVSEVENSLLFLFSYFSGQHFLGGTSMKQLNDTQL